MKNQFRFIFIIFLFTSCIWSKQLIIHTEKLNGLFSYNKILNEYHTLDTDDKKTFKIFIENLNTKLMEVYLKEIENENFEEANKLLKQDTLLSKMSTREIVAFYTLKVVNKFNLLDYYCITLDSKNTDATIAVYLTKDQLDCLELNSVNSIELKVKYLTEEKLTAFKIYKLAEN